LAELREPAIVKSTLPHLFAVVVFGCAAVRAEPPTTGRETCSLDGVWQIADSVSATEMPVAFPATVPVPGLANLAQPAFKDVDRFISRENLVNRISAGAAPAAWLDEHWKGKVEQERNWFWYRRTFRAPRARASAVLEIKKAQFGTAVWLNGRFVGEYPGCFTASRFRLDEAIRWDAENTLVVRIGAHPAVLPDTYPTGSDFEKNRWTPGIYDRVSVIYRDDPAIETVQVAPRLATSEIVVQTTLRNGSSKPVEAVLRHAVRAWKSGERVGEGVSEQVRLHPGEEKTFTRTVAIPGARMWSPDDPFLHVLETDTGGDRLETRFGMREFRFDPVAKRALLNGEPVFLRGSNIALHRFFEDPLCRDLPWNDAWVRKLLGEVPRRMHWNYFRFCIGPVPGRWFDICDEEGVLVQNEFFVWTGTPEWNPGYGRTYDIPEMIRQYRDWMRDGWNHPSVVVWDANNETKDGVFGDTIIPAVRRMDLSNRPWENSYNAPAGPDDPVEYHPYLMIGAHRGEKIFDMAELETMDGSAARGVLPSEAHAPIINEYGWLWLNRDGSPTLLTGNVYRQLLGDGAAPRERLDLLACLLAAKTEYWRAHRRFAGIVHFVYLTCGYDGAYTSDNFADVGELRLDPAFADYVGEAFKPLGACLAFFRPALEPGERRAFRVMLVNDHRRAAAGTVRLTLRTPAGAELAGTESRFAMEAAGQACLDLELAVPAGASGPCLLQAAAAEDGAPSGQATLSRRRVTVAPALVPARPE
jgi:hypothetical protein